MTVELGVRTITDWVDKRIAPVKPFRAIVTSVSGGLIGIRKPEAASGGTALYARVMGFPISVADEVLCVNLGKLPIIIGKIQRAPSGLYPIGEATSDLTTITGRIKSAGASPTIAANAGAGTGASALIEGTDRCGLITLNVGTGPAVGSVATITFNAVKPDGNFVVFLFPQDASAMSAVAAIRVGTRSTTGWVITNTTTALTASNDYLWYYLVEEYEP